MKKLNLYLSNFEKILVNVLLLTVTSILFINVILRLMGKSIPWAEEFARYGIVWVTFIGTSICVYKGAHIGVDAITMILNNKSKKILSILTLLVSIVFIIIFIQQSYLITMRALSTGQVSATLKVSMVYIYGAMPVGALLTLLRLIQEVYRQIKSMASNHGEAADQ